MSLRRLMATSGVALCLSLGSVGSHAALVTLTGTNFDLTYDDTKLGLFGTPTLSGNTLSFTFSGFLAHSLNGEGAVGTNSTISGLVLTAKDGYQFGAFDLREFGDYTLSGEGSFVRVQGQLRAFNIADANLTQTSDNLAVNPSTPLTINDGTNRNWNASAHIDSSTAADLFGIGQNVILSKPSEVGITIENRLLAFTDRDRFGFREALIEKKFAGVQMTVMPLSPVPLPPAVALLAAGLSMMVFMGRRRRAHA